MGISAHNTLVSFDLNGGSGTAPDVRVFAETFARGERVFPVAPTRSDHTFTGWNTQVDGLGAPVTSSSTLPDDGPSEVAAYAIWTRNATPPPLPPGEVTFGAAVVSVSGTPQVGQPLTASLSGSSVPGQSVAWQWRDLTSGTDIAGADGPGYTPTADQVGHSLRVTATRTAPGYTTRSDHADTTTVAQGAFGPAEVSISGVAKVGQPLNASLSGDSVPGQTLTWQWHDLTSGVDIAGATARGTPRPRIRSVTSCG